MLCWLFLSFLIMFFLLWFRQPHLDFISYSKSHIYSRTHTNEGKIKRRNECKWQYDDTGKDRIRTQWKMILLSFLCHSFWIQFSLYEHSFCFCEFIPFFTDWFLMHEYAFFGWMNFSVAIFFVFIFYCKLVIN